MHSSDEKKLAEADAAADRLRKSLRSAKSLVRDYRAKLGKKAAREADEPKGVFRFER